MSTVGIRTPDDDTVCSATYRKRTEMCAFKLQRQEEIPARLFETGHKSNSKAEEISAAMQRSASVAQEAGVDFEHLATWITIISERTRLSADVIGTSIQSILARLHQMRKSGYAEDGITTNMIQDALLTVGNSIGENLSLFLEDGRTWKDAQVVFEEIANAWYKMDDAQRAYITTMMSGTRQQDRFLNLMKGMAKEGEEMSRYQQLLGVAMTASGSTLEKYNKWMEGATAAQNDFIAATQELYNTVGAVDILKTFYYVLADIVESFGAS